MLRILQVGQVKGRQAFRALDQSNYSGEPVRLENLPLQATAALWSSSDENVFTVIQQGPFCLITGVGAGTATLTCIIPNGTDPATVTHEEWVVYAPGTPGAIVGGMILDS